MPKFQTVIDLEVSGGIAILTIQNPPANALSQQMLAGIDACLDSIEADETIRVVIVTGEGKFFVAGADIKEMLGFSADLLKDLNRNGQRIVSRLETLAVPVIAAINGLALGGGLELALACDIRIAAEQAVLGLPEVGLGLVPAYGGLSRLAGLIGEGNAKKLIYTGASIRAQEACSLGIVQEVAVGVNLMERCMALAKQISCMAPGSVQRAKAAIYARRSCTLEESLENEAEAFFDCYTSENGKEGIRAFTEKRRPVYKDKWR